eukprot:m.175583 g.175583  ORF g.175583 m.175583 type:complete len:167 (+) comp18362_c0_seq1:85-585(+)
MPAALDERFLRTIVEPISDIARNAASPRKPPMLIFTERENRYHHGITKTTSELLPRLARELEKRIVDNEQHPNHNAPKEGEVSGEAGAAGLQEGEIRASLASAYAAAQREYLAKVLQSCDEWIRALSRSTSTSIPASDDTVRDLQRIRTLAQTGVDALDLRSDTKE